MDIAVIGAGGSVGRTVAQMIVAERLLQYLWVMLKPFITHFSGAKTAVGAARTTLALLRTITSGNDALISGQVCIAGEFYGIHGTIGVPFVVGNQGVDRIVEIPLRPAKKELLVQAAQNVQRKIDAFL